MNYYNVFFYGNNEPKVVFGHSLDTVMNEYTEMFGDSTVERVEPLSIHQKEKEYTQRGANVSVLTGYNPFAGRITEAEEKKKEEEKKKPGNVTINVAGDTSDDGPEEEKSKEVEGDANTEIDDNSPDANGDGKVDAKDDLNKDGKVDAKDLKIAELEKDLRIKELEKGIEEMDDPAPEEKMKKASRLRIKDRGDSFECVDESGKCHKSFPYDNKETFAKAARYDAQRFAEKHYAKQIGEDVELNLDEKRAFIFAAAQAKKEGKKKFTFNGKEYPVTIKADLIKEDVLEEGVDKKILKMLKNLDTEEAMMIINGMPKKDQRAYRKALGIKEMVDGRTKAYRETAKRLMSKKKSEIDEGENSQVKGGDPCWEGYEMVGMKMQNGKEVPNCVPVSEARRLEAIEVAKIREQLELSELNFKKVKRPEDIEDLNDLGLYITQLDDGETDIGEFSTVMQRLQNWKSAFRKFPKNASVHAKNWDRVRKGFGGKLKLNSNDMMGLVGEEVAIYEAGYNDQPKTKAEMDKKHPDTETDVKNKDSKDLQKLTVAESYSNYIKLTNKK